MKKTLFKSLCLTLAALCILAGFSGCAKEETVELKKVQYVYRSQDFAVPEELKNVSAVFPAGDSVYLYGNYYNEDYTVFGPRLYRIRLDGSESERIPLGIDDTREEGMMRTYAMATTMAASEAIAVEDVPDDAGETENRGENVSLQNVFVQADGSVWCVINHSVYDSSDPENYYYEENYILKKLDGNGEDLLSVDLSVLRENEDDWFYVNSLVVDADGYCYLVIPEGVAILDPAGKLHAKLTLSDDGGGIDRLVLSGSGKAVCNMYAQNGGNTQLCEIDRDAKAFRDPVSIGTEGVYNYYTVTSGYGCDVFYYDSEDVYAFDMATGTSTKVMNFINSDLDSDSTYSMTPISETQIISVGYDRNTGSSALYLLTKVPDEEIVAKRIITLGTTGLNWNTRQAVIDFNKSSEEYRIEVRDYSSYNGMQIASSSVSGEAEYDWEAGMKKFNTDLISGNIPDIIEIDSNMPYDSYVAKGMLADLYPFFEKDESISRDDYMGNIFQALETKGKLYSVTPSFNVYTVIGKASKVGDRESWTMDDMLAVLEAMPEGAQLFSEMTRGNFMEYALTLSSESFIDRKNGTCSFDTDSFRKLLEIAKRFPEEIDYDTLYGENYDWTEYELQYRNDKTLLQVMYMSDFRYLHTLEAATFGEPVSLIGFPTDTGAGSALILNEQYAIAASSKNQDGAWAFLRSLLSDEYQEDTYGFPVKRSALAKMKEEAMKPYTYEDADGNIVEVPNTYYINDQEIDIGYPTQEDVDRIERFISGVTNVYRTDSSLMDIVNEEAGAFFAGQKQASEVSALIQSRVQIYISESR